MAKINCDFCGKELDEKNDRVINAEFYEDIEDGFAEGREDLADVSICADCFESEIKSKIQ